MSAASLPCCSLHAHCSRLVSRHDVADERSDGAERLAVLLVRAVASHHAPCLQSGASCFHRSSVAILTFCSREQPEPQELSITQIFIAGGMAGAFTSFVESPFDLVKVCNKAFYVWVSILQLHCYCTLYANCVAYVAIALLVC